ncbi:MULTISPECIES: coiled-coil domain-containing protein [unclassified Undibacterium]|uniref:coiled-coil domain-containing protein n=2 Tax=Pseudomonadota TaxID=1224 RepID=UPI002AC94E04|nr:MULTISPECIES: coiled-coil domain-containing protein [unclassified Undibacterium]MEB0139796.1 DUF1640 domain-containing protein [Undibacterium sp. CCC2.1]MEB0170496.1 DUF1640 domain-containing protein [Undibacterium sp. CCC1.1]MEB0174437.1 DUF1640 domain-containing protein [Undibacterium sp. CCC3.4]MEB0213766.1 DUF1640 domain-containing protein [Undibacterium sp. 5I2]WPX43929.1 DUF1640 domain-containing protein [Undibacterium sp. CCC3.4]
MNAIPFNTLRMTEQLEAAGVPPQQAKAQSSLLAEIMQAEQAGLREHISDKQDINEKLVKMDCSITALRTEIGINMEASQQEMKSDMTIFRHQIRADMDAFRQEMRADMDAFRQEMRAEMAAFQQKIHSEMEVFRREIQAEMAAFQQKMRSDMDAFRQEMQAEFAAFRQETKSDIARLEHVLLRKIAKTQSDNIRWIVSAGIVQSALITGLMLKLAH